MHSNTSSHLQLRESVQCERVGPNSKRSLFSLSTLMSMDRYSNGIQIFNSILTKNTLTGFDLSLLDDITSVILINEAKVCILLETYF